MLLELVLTVAAASLIYLLVFRREKQTLPMGDGWWGPGQRPDSEEDESVCPFRVETSEEELKDLHHRLDATRLTPPLEDARFHYGVNSHYLRKVLDYWRNQFDWKKQVDILNSFPHFKTRIEGIEVHFVYVKPGRLLGERDAIPLLMVHGWPGSFYEFYKILPLLTEPEAHGLSQEHVFQVVCPSIPGYGFSEAPHKKGFDTVSAGRIFYKLMRRLGFQKFYVQGGDWGSMICINIAQMAPSHVRGLHVNFVPLAQGWLVQLLSLMFGRHLPALFGFEEEDLKRLFPFMEKGFYHILKESGYLHIQATKPDTIGFGLNDSPAGLAAYIMEKFSTWINPEFRDLEDGGLERKLSLDELLTNVMIYWVSGTIASSMRFYKENLGNGIGNNLHEKIPVQVPTGIAAFPHELLHIPRLWARQKFPNIVRYSFLPRGGHFAAFEEPALLADEIHEFVATVERV
uniref:Epoxide hydrolase n=1 Tax=Callorhinchus milii TaxID=7868 RepID=K4G0H7_CALMI|nr:epoxide hydrolase 1-like protein [Callorhinchus milii]